MLYKLNLQYIFSYLGLIPFFFIQINKYFFLQIIEKIILNFSIYYSLIIIVFIGAINWNLDTKLKNTIVFYGFFPSLFSTIIIILNINKFNQFKIILSIIIFFLIQLFFEYLIIHRGKTNKNVFYFLRLPLTLLIVTSLFLVIF